METGSLGKFSWEKRKRKAGRIIRHVTSAAANRSRSRLSSSCLECAFTRNESPLTLEPRSGHSERSARRRNTSTQILSSVDIRELSNTTSEDIFTVPNSRGGPINQALGVEQVSFLPSGYHRDSSPVCFSSFGFLSVECYLRPIWHEFQIRLFLPHQIFKPRKGKKKCIGHWLGNWRWKSLLHWWLR